MLKNRWARYLTYLICLWIVFRLGGVVLLYLQQQMRVRYVLSPNMVANFALQTLVFVMIGVLVGVFDFLSKQIEKPGRWKVNRARLVILGIPMAFIASRGIWYTYGVAKAILGFAFFSGVGLVTATQVLLGYVLATSFYKEPLPPNEP